ncbi:MAG: CARDB domain-containing protein, partial [Myxococcota bacterium]
MGSAIGGKWASICLLICGLFITTGCGEPVSPKSVASPDPFGLPGNRSHAPREVLVKFKPSVPLTARAMLHRQRSASVIARLAPLNVERIRLADGETVEEALLRYRGNAEVEYAEPNIRARANQLPNDPRFSDQWWLNNTGQTGGTPGADIHAPAAWDVSTGNPQVVVAVIDTGIDWTHPDLAPNSWTNPNEISNNSIDDDGNGYVDDVRGWNFVSDNAVPFDDNSHGTHVAGIAAAVGNNGVGVAGVAWQAKLMPLKFLDSAGDGSMFAAASALTYAADHGAQVANNSWGCDVTPCYSQTVEDAIAYAKTRGMLVVAAAMNNGANNDAAPTVPCNSAQTNVLCVAATADNDSLAYWSNYGAGSVDLAAPGTGILSTIPGADYGEKSGTSMATPAVSGAAALVWGTNLALTHEQVKASLYYNVDVVASLSGKCATSGRLNAANAVTNLYAGAPDLVATTVSGPVQASPGETISVSDTVVNQGGGGASGFFVGLYLSPDPVITTADTALTQRWVNSLAAGASSSATTSVTIPLTTPTGTYYLGAIADSSSYLVQSSTANDSQVSSSFSVSPGADLQMTAVSGPTSGVVGTSINVSTTVANNGTFTSTAFSVGIYLSPDPVITLADTRLGTRSVGALGAGASDTASTSVVITPGLTGGTYYLGAIADVDNATPESDESNNSLAGNTIAVAEVGQSDLVVTAVSGPAAANPGTSISVSNTVLNQGTTLSGGFFVGIYLSTDATITTSDTLLGLRWVASLAVGTSNSAATSVTIASSVPAGNYYLGAIVDYASYEAESDEGNNARLGNAIVVGNPGADLVMTAISGPASSGPGMVASLSSTVRNQGSSAVGAFYVGLYLSTDAVITTSDIRVGTRYVGSLAGGASNTATVNVTVPTTVAIGNYYWGAIADYSAAIAEGNETNNAMTGNAVAVNGPDLVVTA